MKKFIALYFTPTSVLDDWMNTDPDERKALENKMQEEWTTWSTENASALSGGTFGVGKPKRITPEGISDSRNEIMMYSIIEAESHEEAAKLFEKHPHLGIPQSSIDLMEINTLPGMQ